VPLLDLWDRQPHMIAATSDDPFSCIACTPRAFSPRLSPAHGADYDPDRKRVKRHSPPALPGRSAGHPRHLEALRDGTAPADLKNLASKELMAKVTRSAAYAGSTGDFLGGAGKG